MQLSVAVGDEPYIGSAVTHRQVRRWLALSLSGKASHLHPSHHPNY